MSKVNRDSATRDSRVPHNSELWILLYWFRITFAPANTMGIRSEVSLSLDGGGNRLGVDDDLHVSGLAVAAVADREAGGGDEEGGADAAAYDGAGWELGVAAAAGVAGKVDVALPVVVVVVVLVGLVAGEAVGTGEAAIGGALLEDELEARVASGAGADVAVGVDAKVLAELGAEDVVVADGLAADAAWVAAGTGANNRSWNRESSSKTVTKPRFSGSA